MTHMGNFVSAKISLNESYERTKEFQTTKKSSDKKPSLAPARDKVIVKNKWEIMSDNWGDQFWQIFCPWSAVTSYMSSVRVYLKENIVIVII